MAEGVKTQFYFPYKIGKRLVARVPLILSTQNFDRSFFFGIYRRAEI